MSLTPSQRDRKAEILPVQPRDPKTGRFIRPLTLKQRRIRERLARIWRRPRLKEITSCQRGPKPINVRFQHPVPTFAEIKSTLPPEPVAARRAREELLAVQAQQIIAEVGAILTLHCRRSS